MGELQDAFQRFEDAGASLVGVSADPQKDLDALSEKMALSFPLVSDADLALAEAWGVRQQGKDAALPATYVLDGEGEVVFAMVGDHLVDRPSVDTLLAAVERAK